MPMFNGGRNNSPNNGFNVRTFGPRFVGEKSQLTTQYWDNKLAITWYPMSGVDERGFKQFNRDARISTTMKANDAIFLYVEAMRRIVPEIEKYERGDTPEVVSIGVLKGTQTRNLWCLEYHPDEQGDFSTYLVIYHNLNENNKTEQVLVHKFAKREIVSKYDPNTGKAETVMREMDFELFLMVLKSVFETEGPIPHAIQYETAVRGSRQNSGFGSNGGMSNDSSSNYGSNPNSAEPVEYNGEGGDLPF